MLVCTVANQHPSSAFNRLQRKDTLSLLPNWRFFAPTPAMYDYHLLYRTLGQDSSTSPWRELEAITGRRFTQIVWFPTRRQEKAVFDVCSEILRHVDKGFEFVVNVPAYRALLAYIGTHVEADRASGVKGFQFTLVRGAGYDTTEEPKTLFISPYVPMGSFVRETVCNPLKRGGV
ncbi:hypothetical protein [Streptomyces fuscichromogenes]|nr:hypothetical protein [Streptomyces fuscichromogenes]